MTDKHLQTFLDTLGGADIEFATNHVIITGNTKCSRLNSLNQNTVFSIFKEYGAISFRNFNVNYASFDGITKQYCSSFLSQSAGNRKIVPNDPSTQSVNLGHDAFPFHPELSQFPWQPDIAWFCCVETPKHQNEGTLICDGIELANIIETKDRQLLLDNQLVYTSQRTVENISKILEIELLPEFNLQSFNNSELFSYEYRDNNIWASYTCDGLRIPLFSEKLAFNNFLLFSRLLKKINDMPDNSAKNFPMLSNGETISDDFVQRVADKADSIATQMDWQKGDLLMLNNTRVMHARPAVIDPNSRAIITRFGYASHHPDRERLAKHCPWRRNGVIFSQTEGILSP